MSKQILLMYANKPAESMEDQVYQAGFSLCPGGPFILHGCCTT